MSTNGAGTPRVVVGYDASASAKIAVRWAADEAVRRGLPLTVVYAADYTGLVGGPVSMSPWLPGVSIDEARRIADGGAELARTHRPEVTVDDAAFVGSPGTVLIQHSAGAALVVVGSRGHGDVAGLILGSVASRVAAHAHCPVVVVRGDQLTAPHADRPVVVGVDGSPAADAALAAAVETAVATGAPLRVVCAWHPTVPGGWENDYWLAVYPEGDPNQTAREAAERVAADAVAKARELAPELAVESKVRGGDAAAVVLDAAGDDAGLVVIGARGRGSLASLFLGSVSHGVVHGAGCPVLVVRAPATEPTDGEPSTRIERPEQAHGPGPWVPTGLL
jgi:nucleotide-binding universal stress UspA family protein